MNPIYITKETTASFEVDPEKCFGLKRLDELYVPDGENIVPALNALAKLARLRICSKDWHNEHAIWKATKESPQLSPVEGDHLNVDIHWYMHGVGGSEGAQLLDGLPKEIEYDYFVWKGMELDMHPYGACYHDLNDKMSTGVIEYLSYNKISTVILSGLALDFCVKNTAIQLAKAGFNVIVVLEACRGINEELTAAAKLEMLEFGVKFAETVDQIIST
jgi:nicotinamidase/pyrazinamidase